MRRFFAQKELVKSSAYILAAGILIKLFGWLLQVVLNSTTFLSSCHGALQCPQPFDTEKFCAILLAASSRVGGALGTDLLEKHLMSLFLKRILHHYKEVTATF